MVPIFTTYDFYFIFSARVKIIIYKKNNALVCIYIPLRGYILYSFHFYTWHE